MALIDRQDMLIVGGYSWSATPTHGIWYARRSFLMNGVIRSESMHRLIMQPPRSMVVDHINHDGLDNRRANLRICTHQQNTAHERRRRGDSGFRGVHKRGHMQGWGAAIKIDRKSRWIGTYPSAEEAARAYDRAALDAFGEYATLNFPALKAGG